MRSAPLHQENPVETTNVAFSFRLFLHRLFLSLHPSSACPQCSRYSLALRGRISWTVRSHVKDETPTGEADGGTRSQSRKLLVNFSDYDELPLIASPDAELRERRELLGMDGQIVCANCNNSTRWCIRITYLSRRNEPERVMKVIES